MGLLAFHCPCKISFAVNLKHSSFCPSANFKPILNDLVHVLSLEVSIIGQYEKIPGTNTPAYFVLPPSNNNKF
jgi:hypothetical protein